MVGKGLDPQIRAVGMSANDPEWSIGAAVGIDPGHKCTAGPEVPPPGCRAAIIRRYGSEAGLLEPLDRLVDGMEGAGGGVDIAAEVARPVVGS